MEILVILGSPNKKDGELYDVAIQRCQLALEEFHKNKNRKIIVTGGFGKHFNTTTLPHAKYLQEYLMKKDIPENAFIGMAKSCNTIEDATLTKQITDKLEVSSIKIITSDYHTARAKFIFEHYYKNTHIKLKVVGAKTNDSNSELDIISLRQHEKKALKKLKDKGIDKYYSAL